MAMNQTRVVLVVGSFVATFVLLRIYLHLFPATNLDIAGYNIHHLFTGLVLITVGGLPLIFFAADKRILQLAAIAFGSGLAMALDEWVYLIATDGSDSAYLSPVSLWGAVITFALVLVYVLLLIISAKFNQGNNKQ